MILLTVTFRFQQAVTVLTIIPVTRDNRILLERPAIVIL
nr:MAG TPA: hypothetical protein [Caudoviricetes sp.]DAQ19404.1 MAG TPA: hypothetical protein [Caudoviricetes sp.]